MNKEELAECVRGLLNSAKSRSTSQGVSVYDAILKQVSGSGDDKKVEEVRKKLENALNGMEAHGHFTNEEFSIVKKNRGF